MVRPRSEPLARSHWAPLGRRRPLATYAPRRRSCLCRRGQLAGEEVRLLVDPAFVLARDQRGPRTNRVARRQPRHNTSRRYGVDVYRRIAAGEAARRSAGRPPPWSKPVALRTSASGGAEGKGVLRGRRESDEARRGCVLRASPTCRCPDSTWPAPSARDARERNERAAAGATGGAVRGEFGRWRPPVRVANAPATRMTTPRSPRRRAVSRSHDGRQIGPDERASCRCLRDHAPTRRDAVAIGLT